MVNYYRRHIPEFSSRARALNRLTRKDVAWEWGEDEDKSWRDLKEALLLHQYSAHRWRICPTSSPPTRSSSGMGAVLSQQRADGTPGVIAYASKSCNAAEQNYSSYEGEMLAVVWAVRTFRHYLLGREFELFTDHQPLSWLMSSTELKGKLARWALLLMEYDFRITYRAGSLQGHVDALSGTRSEAGTVAAAAEGDETWRGFPEAGWLALGGDGPGAADPWDDAGRLQRIKAQDDATQGRVTSGRQGRCAVDATGRCWKCHPGGEGCAGREGPCTAGALRGWAHTLPSPEYVLVARHGQRGQRARGAVPAMRAGSGAGWRR